ncbi:hypothetical protein F4804DRAFT_6622 [Jackrogersella minutella]|nr:hypothetical protein F4804DRAFT_6622 [Jackrogersella minutella]
MHPRKCRSFQLPGDQVCLQSNTSSKESPFSQLVELAPAIACSFVTTVYIVHAESAREELATNFDVRAYFFFIALWPTSTLTGYTSIFQFTSQIVYHITRYDFLRHISPGLALGSCLLLGCSLSSYVHRRRDQDQYQVFVFVIWVTWAICIGWGVGVSANRVTLGIVPWASCAAILSSFFGHAGARWVSGRGKFQGLDFALVDEKGLSFRT